MADNKDQIEFWSGPGGAKWLAAETRLERGLAQFGDAALAAAAPRPGECVLDIGCGTGGTTVKLARAVAPGKVTGLDVSPPLLAAARRHGAGIANLEFTQADAAAQAFAGEYDLLYSRFGVMFFDDPFAAFANMRRALKPTGRLAFVCWRTFKENGWAFVPFTAALKHVPAPERRPPEAPGPFAFGAVDRTRTIVERAGFVDVVIAPVDGAVDLGASVDQAVESVLQVGPTSRLLADADPADRAKAAAEIARTLRPYLGPGGIALPGAVWIVTARAS